MKGLVVLLVFAVVFLLVLFIGTWIASCTKLAKDSLRKLKDADAVMEELHRLAIENREIDPFAEIVLNKTRSYLTGKSPR